jgi:hypothetical protein
MFVRLEVVLQILEQNYDDAAWRAALARAAKA